MKITIAIILVLLSSASFAQHPRYENIFEAAKAGDIADVRLWLQLGAPIEMKRENNLTPLLVSLKYSHADLARLLLSRGANANARSDEGWSAIHYAVTAFIDTAFLSVLIKHGADIDDLTVIKSRPLELAVFERQHLMVRQLLVLGAYPDNYPGLPSPLHAAISKDDPVSCKILLEFGADMERRYMGNSARAFAFGRGSFAVQKIFAQYSSK